MRKQCNILLSSLALCTLPLTMYATSETETLEIKRGLKSNGESVFMTTQKSANNFQEMFQNGNFYGRLRNNNFFFSYEKESASTENNLVGALGVSLIYESATYNNFAFQVGLYSSQSFFDDGDLDDIAHLKPAKDTLSRFEYINTGSKSLFALGQANIRYRYNTTDFIFGRQLVETFYTRSNDTKMIPNTFDGFVIDSKVIPDSRLKLAYLAKEKLRDHKDAHAVFMVGDANSSSAVNPQWSEQDDSAMHRGLTYTNLKNAGKPTDAPLLVADFQNKTVENLRVHLAGYSVPQLLAQTMAEFDYTFEFQNFTITPGVRYLHQFDNGAGGVGGASIFTTYTDSSGVTRNFKDLYDNPNSLESDMLALRLVTRFDDYKINLAYSGVFDKADLVTPWRGFPTSGYTRSMGIYNWRANVQSYRLELVKGAQKNGVYTDGFIQTSVLYIDGDQTKLEVDRMMYYFGYVKNLKNNPNFQYRLRLGYNDFVGASSDVPDYLDSRLEFNYLF